MTVLTCRVKDMHGPQRAVGTTAKQLQGTPSQLFNQLFFFVGAFVLKQKDLPRVRHSATQAMHIR